MKKIRDQRAGFYTNRKGNKTYCGKQIRERKTIHENSGRRKNTLPRIRERVIQPPPL